ncbi:MAG: OmpA family protein [Blastocatellia bacterium]
MKKLFRRFLIVTIIGANLLILYFNIRYVRKESPQKPAPESAQTGTPPHNETMAEAKNPSNPEPQEPKRPEVTPATATSRPDETTSILPLTVTFDSRDSKPSAESQEKLVKLFNEMSQNADLKIEVGGHADSQGDPLKNVKLSVERANTIKSYLVGLGIPESRIVVQGYGSIKPIADNGTEEGRRRNRRVEIVELKPKA